MSKRSADQAGLTSPIEKRIWLKQYTESSPNEFYDTKQHEPNQSPKTEETTKSNESPKTEETTISNESPKTEETTKSNESPKTEETTKSNESPKTEETTKSNESPKTEETTKSNESPKTKETEPREHLSDCLCESKDHKTCPASQNPWSFYIDTSSYKICDDVKSVQLEGDANDLLPWLYYDDTIEETFDLMGILKNLVYGVHISATKHWSYNSECILQTKFPISPKWILPSFQEGQLSHKLEDGVLYWERKEKETRMIIQVQWCKLTASRYDVGFDEHYWWINAINVPPPRS